MDDLADTLRAKLAELAIDWNATSGVDHRERGISAITRVQPDGFVSFVFSGPIRVGAFASRRSGQHLELICGFVQFQRERGPTLVPFPSTKSDEPRAACETFGVIGDDVMRMLSGNEPPNDYRPAGLVRIRSGDFEDEKI